ncbi:MAG TPA: DUF5668 domain-containing protein [Bryobacteraceae bacterium]|nr:DUF5668 domain-containing protein [Bryobacteraceae bacterium]
MNSRLPLFVQAIRGPVLLITLGVLFALHQAGVLSFARTWPLILIMIGVMKLIERMVMRPGAAPPPPMGGPYV